MALAFDSANHEPLEKPLTQQELIDLLSCHGSSGAERILRRYAGELERARGGRDDVVDRLIHDIPHFRGPRFVAEVSQTIVHRRLHVDRELRQFLEHERRRAIGTRRLSWLGMLGAAVLMAALSSAATWSNDDPPPPPPTGPPASPELIFQIAVQIRLELCQTLMPTPLPLCEGVPPREPPPKSQPPIITSIPRPSQAKPTPNPPEQPKPVEEPPPTKQLNPTKPDTPKNSGPQSQDPIGPISPPEKKQSKSGEPIDGRFKDSMTRTKSRRSRDGE